MLFCLLAAAIVPVWRAASASGVWCAVCARVPYMSNCDAIQLQDRLPAQAAFTGTDLGSVKGVRAEYGLALRAPRVPQGEQNDDGDGSRTHDLGVISTAL